MNFELTTSLDAENPIVGDLHFVKGSPRLISGPQEIAQRVRARLLFFRGEWFLDRREGIPYVQHVYGKRRDLFALRLFFRRVLLGVPGIQAVPTLAVELDRARRSATVHFEAILESGHVFSSRDFGPFIVPAPFRKELE